MGNVKMYLDLVCLIYLDLIHLYVYLDLVHLYVFPIFIGLLVWVLVCICDNSLYKINK